MELRLRLSLAACLALGSGDEIVFALPESEDTVSLSLDDEALDAVRERVNAWLLERVPAVGGQH